MATVGGVSAPACTSLGAPGGLVAVPGTGQPGSLDLLHVRLGGPTTDRDIENTAPKRSLPNTVRLVMSQGEKWLGVGCRAPSPEAGLWAGPVPARGGGGLPTGGAAGSQVCLQSPLAE